MSLMYECASCHKPCSMKSTDCPRCGSPLPKRRAYWLNYRIGKKLRWERLGYVSPHVARELEAKRKTQIADAKYGMAPPIKPAVPTFEAVLDRYVESVDARGGGSVKALRTITKRLNELWGDLPCDEVSAVMVEDFKTHSLRDGMSQAYCDRHLQAIRAAYNLSGQESPVRGKMLLNPDNRLFRSLTEDEAARLFKAVAEHRPHILPMLAVAVSTGLRLGNVLNLEWEQIDFNENVLRVVQKGKVHHVIPLSMSVRRLLVGIPRTSRYVFVNPLTRLPYMSVAKAWRSCKKLAGIDRPFRWHDLRHHFATMAHGALHDAKVVQELLGHTQLATTLRYLHTPTSTLRAAIDRIDGSLDKALYTQREAAK